MPPLPFTLRIPGQDHSAGGLTSWSTFKVHGFLHFDGARLVLEWAVTANTSEVDGLEVRSEVEPLPAEALEVPLDRLRGLERSDRPDAQAVAEAITAALRGIPRASIEPR